MKILYIYNKENKQETDLLDNLKVDCGSYVSEIVAYDFQDIKEYYPITSTPAAIFIREDLQGENVLTENNETGKSRLILELIKAIENEEKVLYNVDTERIDSIINSKVQTQMAENYQVMQDMAALLSEGGIV